MSVSIKCNCNFHNTKKTQKLIMLQRTTIENALSFLILKSIYNYSNIFMVSWWGTYSYLSDEQIQIGGVDIMTSSYGSSGSFGSRVSYKSIV